MGLIWRQVADARWITLGEGGTSEGENVGRAAAIPLIPDAIHAVLDAISQPLSTADFILSACCMSHIKF